ncbi:MAG: glycerol-3-phosphate acyltransferase [Candidatus Cloacimonetes bacterium]|nr:glycerol-3-phosphate acyltransferase [Candidatus Cloacimonadota bacterium]
MISVIAITILIIISYLLGCFSTAKLLAKSYKSLNVYKVGSGLPDTQNIYNNVGKTLGIFTGIVDFGKMYFYIVLLHFVLNYPPLIHLIGDIGSRNYLFIISFFMVIGHCLPITHRFRGGRGLFTYIGFVLYFAPCPMLIIILLAIILVVAFKQIRFAQYMIVLLPPLINFFFEDDVTFLAQMFIVALLMGIINFVVSKKLGEI